MNRFTSFSKSLVVAGVAFGALGATSFAQARADRQEHVAQAAPARIAVGEPYGHRHVPPPAPVPDAGRRGPWGDADRDGVPNRYDRDSRFHDGRYDDYRHHGHRAYYRDGWRHRAAWADYDGDGVPNRYDRAPYNPRRY